MKRARLLIFFLLPVIASCDSHTVEQIPVEIPPGVKVPEGMVYIPAGEFVMGHPGDPKTAGGKTVTSDAYLIDQFEVTKGAYQKLAEDEKSAAFPQVLVSFKEAKAYCQSLEKRLPTEIEWEKAARGTDGRKWPWEIYFEHPNNGFSGFIPEPVDKRQEWISPYGVYGMGHNVWEWTEDDYHYSGQSEKEKGQFKAIRGGLYQTHLKIDFSPTHARNYIEPEARLNFLGFRCAKSVR